MLQFTIKTSAEARKFIANAEKKLFDHSGMLARAGLVMLRSIDQNFKSGGRPTKWAPLSEMTKALRRTGGGSGGPQILQDTGRLRSSITSKVESNQVRIGTNVEYASLMHFGGTSKGGEVTMKGGDGSLSPWGFSSKGERTFNIGPRPVTGRPFVMFQREDIIAIEKVGLKHIEDATK